MIHTLWEYARFLILSRRSRFLLFRFRFQKSSLSLVEPPTARKQHYSSLPEAATVATDILHFLQYHKLAFLVCGQRHNNTKIACKYHQ